MLVRTLVSVPGGAPGILPLGKPKATATSSGTLPLWPTWVACRVTGATLAVEPSVATRATVIAPTPTYTSLTAMVVILTERVETTERLTLLAQALTTPYLTQYLAPCTRKTAQTFWALTTMDRMHRVAMLQVAPILGEAVAGQAAARTVTAQPATTASVMAVAVAGQSQPFPAAQVTTAASLTPVQTPTTLYLTAQPIQVPQPTIPMSQLLM